MRLYQYIIAICIGIALFSMTSCTMSKDELKRIVRKEAGKDDFRDSEKWGKVVKTAIACDTFTHIELTGNADVKFKQGDEQSVEVQGNEKAIAEHDIDVKDGILTVKRKDENKTTIPSIKLVVTAPNLESIEVAGAGDIDMKDETELAGDLTIQISGVGDVELERLKCQNLSVHISGAGDISAQKIKCKKADVQISGTGDMTADLKANDINVEISGAGDANLDVKCQNLTVWAGGTGEIDLKGECSHLTKRSGGMASIDSRKLRVSSNIKIE